MPCIAVTSAIPITHLPQNTTNPPLAPAGGEGSGVRGATPPRHPAETPTPKPQTQQLNASREDAKTRRKHRLPKTDHQSPPRPRRGRGVGGEGATPPQHPKKHSPKKPKLSNSMPPANAALTQKTVQHSPGNILHQHNARDGKPELPAAPSFVSTRVHSWLNPFMVKSTRVHSWLNPFVSIRG